MIKVSQEWLARAEADYPEIVESVDFFESLDLPPCEHCGSPDTAAVQAGFLGRSFQLSQATTKFHLTANNTGEGSLWCHSCRRFFGPLGKFDSERYHRTAK